VSAYADVLADPRVAQCSDVEFWVSMPDGVWKVRSENWSWRAHPPASSGRTGYCLASLEAVINDVLTWPEGPR
jgi:hypothetical protein